MPASMMFLGMADKEDLDRAGDLKTTPGYAGTICGKGQPQIPLRTRLYMNTALCPFKKPNGNLNTGADVTDVNHRPHYQNQPGSLDHFINHGLVLSQQQQARIANYVKSGKIDHAQHAGSFVVRTSAKGSGHPKEVEIGRDPIVSRWNVQSCANCQNSLSVHHMCLRIPT